MRLVALDLETTGLDPQKHQILQVGMVCFESTTGEIVGEFETLVRDWKGYHGDPYSLAMNAELLKRIADREGVFSGTLWDMMLRTLRDWGFAFDEDDPSTRPHAVGFNVGSFDIQFLKAAEIDLFHHRSIEVGSLLMNSFNYPSPVTSRQWAYSEGHTDMPHTALADCHMAVKAYIYAMGFE
jgi:oligoribonuclease (3'-5' exoribonuclease)